MSLLEILPIAVALAMDAFAVSVAAGAAGRACGGRATFRLAFHFGLFQFLMPVIGWFVGSTFADRVEAVDHWIAFSLLTWIGVAMIRSSRDDGETTVPDPSRGWSLVALSVATSLDALAIGLSLALLDVSIWWPATVIGLVAAAFSIIGHRGGDRLGRGLGKRAELVGGGGAAGDRGEDPGGASRGLRPDPHGAKTHPRPRGWVRSSASSYCDGNRYENVPTTSFGVEIVMKASGSISSTSRLSRADSARVTTT